MASAKSFFFARSKGTTAARPPSDDEILDSSNELIEDTPEPSPAVAIKPGSKVFNNIKQLSDSGISDGVYSKNTLSNESKSHIRQHNFTIGQGEVSDSSHIIEASDSDSDDDVPLVATKKQTKANVISSDSEDIENSVDHGRFQTFAAKNKDNSNILTDDYDSDSFVATRNNSADKESSLNVSQATKSNLSKHGETRSSSGFSEGDRTAMDSVNGNDSSKSSRQFAGRSSNNTSTASPDNSSRSASDSIVWSEPRKGKKNIIDSDSDSELESGEESDESGDSYVKNKPTEEIVKVTPPPSTTDESDDDFQPTSKPVNKTKHINKPNNIIYSDESSGDDFKPSKSKDTESLAKRFENSNIGSLKAKPNNETSKSLDKPKKQDNSEDYHIQDNSEECIDLDYSDDDFKPSKSKETESLAKRFENSNVGSLKAKPINETSKSLDKPKKQANSEECIDLDDSDSDIEPVFVSKPQRAPTIPRVNSGSKLGMPTKGERNATPEDVRDIEQKIQRLTAVIKQNKNDVESTKLPDGGARLRQVIQQDSEKLKTLRELLVKKRNNQIKSNEGTMFKQPLQEISPGVKPIDNRPVAATVPQSFGLLQSELASARRKLGVLRGAASTARNMPDGGKQLMMKIGAAEKEIAEKEAQLLQLNQGGGKLPTASNIVNQAWQAQRMDLQGFGMSAEERAKMLGEFGQNNMYGGRMNQSRRQEVRSVTMDALKAMHTSLETMPAEGNEEEQPLSLRSAIQLFPHQKQALAWLLWRETQHPTGGILADDMGLGKTLTMISLILKHRELEAEVEKARMERGEEAKENNWNGKGSELVRSKTTLIVCPASLLGQWEKEVDSKVKSGRLRVLVYHGNNRKCSARALARYDLVITTYGTVQSEVKSVLGDKADKEAKTKMDDLVAAEDMTSTKGLSELLGVAWERIILDEAHIIRNPRSLTSQSVCRLRAERRWCLSGTPIQNKELDMYALVRFIRCSPFDEYRVWKVWIDNKSAQGQERMNTLVRSLLLRRTKETKSQVTGKAIVDLPDKLKTEHKIELTSEERQVYMEVFSFSQAALKRYMDQNEEKQEMKELGFSGSGAAKAKSSNEDFSYRPGAGSEMEQPENVKAHHILVLLLRLRQICCHPGLIKSMLDTETKATEGLQDDDGEELDLISAMEDMSVSKSKPQQKILDLSNPVFGSKRISSKILTVIEELKELKRKGKETGFIEKTVIVSQWTSMLQIIKVHVEAIGLRCAEINGQIPVKLRGNIVTEFNTNPRGTQVMLLSLAAGGVGLNLVGANHLFLLDMHWNPQLEAQACDRIYRVGQTREVKIHRFVVEDSVEEKILLLQEKKLSLAQDVLTGAKRSGANKLSMDDLKMLFQVN